MRYAHSCVLLHRKTQRNAMPSASQHRTTQRNVMQRNTPHRLPCSSSFLTLLTRSGSCASLLHIRCTNTQTHKHTHTQPHNAHNAQRTTQGNTLHKTTQHNTTHVWHMARDARMKTQSCACVLVPCIFHWCLLLPVLILCSKPHFSFCMLLCIRLPPTANRRATNRQPRCRELSTAWSNA
jgi:hypothetical protein